MEDLPIHLACSCSHVSFEMIQYLVEQAPSTLCISNNNGALPIHVACQFGVLLQVIKYLVEENGGADTLRSRDNNGDLPLHTLCGSNQPSLKTVEYLIKTYPAASSTRNNNGALPLHVLCGSTVPPALKSVECLIKSYPAALSARTSCSGELPITLACESASLSVIYALIRGDPHVVPS